MHGGGAVFARKCGGKLEIDCVPVRPIPRERDLWFEKVWGNYRALTEKK